MQDQAFAQRGRQHAAWGDEMRAWARERPARVDLSRSFAIAGHVPCPTCATTCQLAEATDGLEPSVLFKPVDRAHLEECERAILDVREVLLDETLIGGALYDEHLGGCVGSAMCIAGLARDVALLLRAEKRDNARLRLELATETERRKASEWNIVDT